jgi:hypothetical protein
MLWTEVPWIWVLLRAFTIRSAKAGGFGGARSLRDQLESDDSEEDQANAYQPQRRRLSRKYVRTHWAPRSPAQSSTSAPSRGMGGSGVPGLIVRACSQAA